MVAAEYFVINGCRLYAGSETLGGKEIVYTPTHVLLTGAEHIGPPCIGIGDIAVFKAEAVYKSAFEELCHLAPLLIGEARVSPVAFGIFEVYLPVGNIQVAAEDNGLFGIKSKEIIPEGIFPCHAVFEPCELTLGVGSIHIHKIKIGILKGDDSSLGIVLGNADAVGNAHGLMLCENARTGIALFLGAVEIQLITGIGKVQLVGLKFGLLNAEEVCIDEVEKIREALRKAGSESVYIPRYESHLFPQDIFDKRKVLYSYYTPRQPEAKEIFCEYNTLQSFLGGLQMALLIEKFGGSSLSSDERLRNAASIIAKDHKNGHKVVAVVSARGKTTDGLIAGAHALGRDPSPRELDMLLATGEQASAAMMAICLSEMGCPAVSLCGWQAGIKTDGNHQRSLIKDIDCGRIRAELSRGRVPVVAGFQGISDNGNITTIGRGGSDTTAVALASALGADICRIYTDVNGVYSADPAEMPGAVLLSEIGYDEMLEMASMGAKVLHDRSVELAKRYGVTVEVLSSFEKSRGTVVKEVFMEQNYISGVARDANVAAIEIRGVKDSGAVGGIFRVLAEAGICIDMLQLSGENIAFTVPRRRIQETVDAICSRDAGGFEGFSVNDKLCKVSAVGAGMSATPGALSAMYDAVTAENIEINRISGSEIKISVLVPEERGADAAKAVHGRFFES